MNWAEVCRMKLELKTPPFHGWRLMELQQKALDRWEATLFSTQSKVGAVVRSWGGWDDFKATNSAFTEGQG